MNTKNKLLLLLVVALIIGSIVYLDSGKASMLPPMSENTITLTLPDAVGTASTDEKTTAIAQATKDRQALKIKKYPSAREIAGATGFINTDGKQLKLQDLVGKKVVLLDIWTYSCINCQRTFPHLKSWYDKYKDKGLEIVGLHVPEFEFEKDIENVKLAVRKFGITYPVVLDSNHVTAGAYGMRFWPEEYLIDIDGFVVHKSIGEGGYDETEQAIQDALREKITLMGERVDLPAVGGIVDTSLRAQSPETYFGASRNGYLGNGVVGKVGPATFTVPAIPQVNVLYLGGGWNVAPEYAESASANAEIVFRYKAGHVYFVAEADTDTAVEVYRDGVHVQTAKGADVDVNGTVSIKISQLYKLIEGDDGEEHTLRLVIPKGSLKAYTFTFG